MMRPAMQAGSQDGNDDARPAAIDTESAYRNYVAEVILEYASANRTLDNPEAYRRVMAITGRTLGTVKNWLWYRTNLPDLASLARLVEHWNIPPTSIFPGQLRTLLSGVPLDASSHSFETAAHPGADHVFLSLHGHGDNDRVDQALSKYTEYPQLAVLLRQESSDMLDDIRPGELMLVDTGCELIRGSGIYLLRFDNLEHEPRTHARFVEVLLSRPVARIRGGSASASNGSEEIPISGGEMPGVTVLGRVVGVLRQV